MKLNVIDWNRTLLDEISNLHRNFYLKAMAKLFVVNKTKNVSSKIFVDVELKKTKTKQLLEDTNSYSYYLNINYYSSKILYIYLIWHFNIYKISHPRFGNLYTGSILFYLGPFFWIHCSTHTLWWLSSRP